MNKKTMLLWFLFGVVVIAGAVAILSMARGSLAQLANQTATAKGQSLTADAASKGSVQATLPVANGQPVPTPFPAVSWSDAPPCANRPENISALSTTMLQANAAPDLSRAKLISHRLAAMNASDVNSLLAATQIQDSERQILLGLAENIATGRLNRASALNVGGQPEIATVGDLLDRFEDGLDATPPSLALMEAGVKLLEGQGIQRAVCANLLMTQPGGQTAAVQWAADGIQKNSVQAVQGLISGQPSPIMDTVTVSPDGRWAIFTSLGNDSGSPLYLLNIKTSQWSNLIALMNANRTGKQSALPLNSWWDMIGWMPDSQRVLIGPSDISALYTVDINSGKYAVLPFQGGGNGGAQFAGLAGNGSRLAFVEVNTAGDAQSLKVYELATKKSTETAKIAYTQGFMLSPRFSPDGQKLAYVIKKGSPEAGFQYAIQVVDLIKGSNQTLIEGNLGLSVPTWSPDGRYIAFTRKSIDQPDRFNAGAPLDMTSTNIWVIEAATGKAQQVTFVNGVARRPVWAGDSQTLAFVTHTGEAGLVNINQPGQIWRAAHSAINGETPEQALITSVFFVP